MIIYNVFGALLLLVGALVGWAVGNVTSWWIGLVVGCGVVAPIDFISRIRRGQSADMMDWKRGAMLFFLPVWFLGIVVAGAGVVVRFVLLRPAETTVATDDRDSRRRVAEPEEPATPPRVWPTHEGPVGALEVDTSGAAPRVKIARWGSAEAILGKENATVWMVATHIPSTVEDAARVKDLTIDAWGVCEAEVELAIARREDDESDRKRIVDQIKESGGVVVASRVVAELQRTRPVVAITATHCGELYAPYVFDCSERSCPMHPW